MANPTSDALTALFNSNKFPTARPQVIAPPATGTGRGTPGAGGGLGGSHVPPTTSSTTSSTGGTGGTGDTDFSPPSDPPLDWRVYLTNWGFTPDIVNELDRLFRTYADPNQASAASLAYIRGTDWYKATFPGIQEGMKLGIVGNEQDYRAYTNQVNDLYQRYYGRTVSGAEVASALTGGKSVSRVNADFAGTAYINANRNDIQYELGAFDSQGPANDAELQAYGLQQGGGLDSALGPAIQSRIAKAQERLKTVFGGQVATPQMALDKFGRLYGSSLGGGISNSDVAA